jgi:ketosteroid isomerase-like protein
VSQENVELVRRIYGADDQIAAFVEMSASDLVVDLTALFLDEAPLQGQDQALSYLKRSPWGSLRFDPERYFDVDHERVLVFSRTIQTGRASGLTLETRGAQQFTFRDGLVSHYKVYPDRDEALKAVGLEG